MKTKLFFAVIILTLFVSAPTYSQLGGLKKKATDAVKKSEPEKSNNSTKTKEPTKVPAETQIASQPKPQKDAKGYIIDDPEVKKLLEGKTIYYFSNIPWMYDPSRGYKVVAATVTKTADSLHLFVVAQKQYGGVKQDKMPFGKESNYYYDKKNALYALIQEGDESILFFNHSGWRFHHAGLMSPDKTKVENVSEEILKDKVTPALQEIKKEKDSEKAKKEIAANETFYKSGEVSAVKNNAQLEAQFLKTLNSVASLPTVAEKDKAEYNKVLLISTDWNVEKNELGTPLKMTYSAWAIGKYTKDGACFFQKVYMKKDYLGGGTYGEVKQDISQSPGIISCELIKQ